MPIQIFRHFSLSYPYGKYTCAHMKAIDHNISEMSDKLPFPNGFQDGGI